MRWALHMSADAIAALHQLPQPLAAGVKSVIQELAENPTPLGMTSDLAEPSFCQISAPGDTIITYEIIDERQVVHVLTIKD